MTVAPGAIPSLPAPGTKFRTLPAALAPLIAEQRWLVWRWELSARGDLTKVPYRAATPGRKASSSNPKTWDTFEAAIAACEAGLAHGIGFALLGSGFGMFDLDKCRSPHTGEITEWAQSLIQEAASYTEITPSGKGLRIIGRAAGVEIHRSQKIPESDGSKLETFRDTARYVTVSGNQLPDTPDALADLDGLINQSVAWLDDEAEAAKAASSKAKTHRTYDEVRSSAEPRTDLPAELDRLIREGVPEGQRSDKFMHVVGWLKDYGWTALQIVDLLERYPEGIAAKYSPGRGDRLSIETNRAWDKAETKVRSEEPNWRGSSRPTEGPEAVGGAGSERPRIRATPYVYRDPKTIPPREWVYGRHLIRRFLSTTVAPGAVGKSSLVLVEAIAMVTGRPLLGITPTQPMRVWYVNLEDPLEETERRVAAICIAYGINPQELEGRLFLDSGRTAEIIIAARQRDGVKVAEPVVEDLTASMLENGIDHMVVDPFVSSHRVTENANDEIDIVAKAWNRVAEIGNASIELVHHVRKGQAGQGEFTVEDGRGAGALLAAARSARVLNQMSRDQAEKAGLTSHRGLFRVDNGKANLAPPPDKSDWFQLVSVPLGNGPDGFLDLGDQVAVVMPWEWPDMLEGMTVDHLRKAQRALEGGCWRENAQSKNWAGIPIADALGIELDAAGKKRVQAMLKVWIENGMFVVVTGHDEQRRPRSFIEVGGAA